MSAFLIFHSTVKDPTKFQNYAQAVGPTLQAFGGSVALRGKRTEVLQGAHDHQAVGVLEFPNGEAARNWYRSEAYQVLVPNRDQAADLVVIAYESPPA